MRALCLALAGIFVFPAELRWTRDGAPTPQALALIGALESAALRGLDPADYDGPLWAERLATLHSPSARVAFDEALTSAAERYVADLSGGRIDPREAGAALEREAPLDARAFVRRLAAAGDAEASLRAIETPLAEYHRTIAALREYAELARRDAGPPLAAASIVNPGDRWSGTAGLAGRLALLGDLRAPHESADLYDGPIVDAVRRFQERHGLVPDGRIGPGTLRALGVPLSARVAQLRLAIERLRWLPQRFPVPPIVVNIPEYRLRAHGPGDVLSMRVVVGTAWDHPTPVFASALEKVVFRPAWNVPASIEREELAEQFERDPEAMARLGFEALDAQNRVVGLPQAIEGVRSGTLRLRQAPGARNALGLVKFDLPNPFGVYLHGTPARALFARTRRDFSHGCIRVEHAEALASRVLGWPAERVREAMLGDRTVIVPVAVRFPVLVLYSTAVVREDGTVQFFEDVYGEDAALERALERNGAQRFRGPAVQGPQDSRSLGAAFGLH